MYDSRAMRSFWCISVMISVFFMGMDGAVDVASTGHAHDGDATNLVGEHTAASPDSAPVSDPVIDHYEHCCHGHMSSITGHVIFPVPTLIAGDQRMGIAPHVRNFAQAPPTPPPNA